MNYKEYNQWLFFRPILRARRKKEKNDDYDAMDEGWKEIRIVLIITFIFSLFIVNWGNHIVEGLGL